MSKLWSSLPNYKKNTYNEKNMKEGIIDTKKPFDFIHNGIKISDDLIVNILMNQNIDKDVVQFVLQNGVSTSGNSYIIDPKSGKNRITSRIETNDKELLGFALSIQHSLKFEKNFIKSGLTTNLCVSKNHKNLDLAKFIIMSIIYEGYNQSIHTGYHFIKEPRTNANIHVYNYFRPLNVSLALEFGYEVPLNDYTLKKLSDYSVRKTEFKDFSLVEKVDRKINISLDEFEFDNLSQDCESITVLNKNKVVGICIYKTVLLFIAKVQKMCPIVRIVYIEMNDRHNHNTTTTIINYLTDLNKYVVMSGVCFANLNNEHLRRSLGFITSGETYLDFYNIHIKEINKNANEVNLLYM